jgi:hypothetical protein
MGASDGMVEAYGMPWAGSGNSYEVKISGIYSQLPPSEIPKIQAVLADRPRPLRRRRLSRFVLAQIFQMSVFTVIESAG